MLGQRPWARRAGAAGSAYGIESDATDIARVINALPGLLAELSRLRTRCEGLEGALEPFVKANEMLAQVPAGRLIEYETHRSASERHSTGPNEPFVIGWHLTAGDFHRAARTALKGDPDDAI